MKASYAFALLFLVVAVPSYAIPAGVEQIELPDAAGLALSVAVAPNGDVWIGGLQGAVRIPPSGSPVFVPLQYPGAPNITVATDGTVWVANGSRVTAIDASGNTLQTYPLAGLTTAAAANDGAVWYSRFDGLNRYVGRIIGGGRTEHTIPDRISSLEPAPGGAMWGLSTNTPHLYLIGPSLNYTFQNLPGSTLFGDLATAPDGSLWIAGGINAPLMMRSPSGTIGLVEPSMIAGTITVDPTGIPWIGGTYFIEFYDRGLFQLQGLCTQFDYRGSATGTDGSLWFVPRYQPPLAPASGKVASEAFCDAVTNYVYRINPTLARAGAAVVGAADIPTVSPALLAALAAVMIAAALAKLRM